MSFAPSAHADQMVIKYPGQHLAYDWELEPHALFAPFDPPGRAKPGGGLGGRATVVLVDNGFIKSINNSVGLGFGADLLFAGGAGIWLPVVMQWNFWLSRNWSVFGEPGVGVYLGEHSFGLPIIAVGGRVRLKDTIALTLRAGYPQFSFGVSFFF